MSRSLNQVTDHLWVAQSRLYTTNSGVFLGGKAACLIDPGIFPEEIDAIAGFLAGRGAEPRAIVLTHSHWDHILGPERFPDVAVIAQASYADTVRAERGDRILKVIADWEAGHGVERHRPFRIPQPDEVFADAMDLVLGDLDLRLVHAPGHAADQLVAYHPNSGTLWAADMLSDLEIPFVGHSLAAYETTLATIAGWDARALVPGHGHVTAVPDEIRTRISDDIAYLEELRARVEEAVRRGLTLAEAVEACVNMHYRHPAENRGPHRLNVESVYVELGGAADSSKVGWSGLTSE